MTISRVFDTIYFLIFFNLETKKIQFILFEGLKTASKTKE